MIYPFLPHMVANHFSDVNNEDLVPLCIGAVGSAFSLAQFLSAWVWGALSDTHKIRLPILMIGLLGNLVCSIWFGMASNLVMAILARFICGLLNGNIGVAKVSTTSVCVCLFCFVCFSP